MLQNLFVALGLLQSVIICNLKYFSFLRVISLNFVVFSYLSFFPIDLPIFYMAGMFHTIGNITCDTKAVT